MRIRQTSGCFQSYGMLHWGLETITASDYNTKHGEWFQSWLYEWEIRQIQISNINLASEWLITMWWTLDTGHSSNSAIFLLFFQVRMFAAFHLKPCNVALHVNFSFLLTFHASTEDISLIVFTIKRERERYATPLDNTP